MYALQIPDVDVDLLISDLVVFQLLAERKCEGCDDESGDDDEAHDVVDWLNG